MPDSRPLVSWKVTPFFIRSADQEATPQKVSIGKASALMLVILRVASGKPNHSLFEE
jgi:hypothetical protein